MPRATIKPTTAELCPQPSPTRRHLLAGLSGAALAGTALAIAGPGASAAEHPDAELLALCAKLELLHAEYTRRSQDETTAWDDMCPAGYCETAYEITATPARTQLGQQAKARAAIAFHQPNDPPLDVELAWSLIRDVAGRG